MLLVDMRASGQFGSRERDEARARGGARGGARVLGDQEQRSRRADHLHRRGRALRAAEEGQAATCCAWSARSWRSRARVARTDLAVGLDFLGQGRAPALGRVPGLGLPRAGRQLGARAAHRLAAPRPGAGVVSDPLEEALPDVGFVELVDLETGEHGASSTPAGPRRRRSTARRARRWRRARRCSSGWAWTPSTSAPTGPTCRR